MQGSSDSPGKPSAEKKRRFTLKIPEGKKRAPRSSMKLQQEQEVVTEEMLDKMKISQVEAKRKPAKVRNSETEVGIGGEPSSIRSFGPEKTKEGSKEDQGVNIESSSSSSKKAESRTEPSYTVLPLSPYGDQSEESEKPTDNQSNNENSKTPAEELELFSENQRMFLIQFPASLPLSKGTGNLLKEENPGSKGGLQVGCSLQDLPSGLVGKMLVYKTGKVKMKIGDTVLDVSPGIKPICPENIMAINTKEKHCCNLGDVDNHVVLTPDLDFLQEIAD